MTALLDNTLIIWAHPWLTQDLLEHVGNHRLSAELKYPCTAPGHLAAQLFLGAATGELSWETAFTGLHSRAASSNLGQLNRNGYLQCPACQLSREGIECGQHTCPTPECWRLLTDTGTVQWYSPRILNDVGGEASEADNQEWLRKLLLATESPRLHEVRVKLAYYRATQSELTSSEIPLFCLSSESGTLFRSIWTAFDTAWTVEKSWRAPFASAQAENQAKELFAQREEFQLHILLAHPPQLAQENGAGPTGNRAVLFDGEFQDATEIAANFSRCRLRGALGSNRSRSSVTMQTASRPMDQIFLPLAAPATTGALIPAGMAGATAGLGDLAGIFQSRPLPAQCLHSVPCVPQESLPSPAQALLRSLQQMPGMATQVSPEVIRAAIQQASAGHDELDTRVAWAAPAGMQAARGQAYIGQVVVPPAAQGRAAHPALVPTNQHAPKAGESVVLQGRRVTAPLQQHAAHASVATKQTWSQPGGSTTPASHITMKRQSTASGHVMSQQRVVRSTATAVPEPGSGGTMMLAQKSQPQSAFKAVAPSSQASIPIRPIASRPPQIFYSQHPYQARTAVMQQESIPVGMPARAADGRPIQMNPTRAAPAVCDPAGPANAYLPGSKRIIADIFARPLANTAPAEPQTASVQRSQPASQSTHPRAASAVQGLKESRPQAQAGPALTAPHRGPAQGSQQAMHVNHARAPSAQLGSRAQLSTRVGAQGSGPCQSHPEVALRASRGLSSLPASNGSLSDLVQGLVPHGAGTGQPPSVLPQNVSATGKRPGFSSVSASKPSKKRRLQDICADEGGSALRKRQVEFPPVSPAKRPALSAGIKSPSVSSGQAGASEALAQPERLASPVSLLSPGPSACKRGRSKGSKNSLQLSSPARFKPSPSLGRARIVVPLNKETPQPEQGPQGGSEATLVTSPSVQVVGQSPVMSPSVQAAGLSPAVSAPAPKRGRPKGRKNGASKSTVVLPASLNETGDAAQPEATNTARQASLVNQPPRKRGRPKGSKNTPLGVRLAADMKRTSYGPLARPDLGAVAPRPKKAPQEFEWLSYGRGKSVDYNEAKLRKQKWNVANKVVKKAMRQRRAAVQSRDSEACGDITQTLVRMMPGQGMLPDGFAGFTIARLHKAVLTGGDERKQASQSAKLTLEDIQAKTGCLGFSILELCKAVLTGGDESKRASLQLARLTLEDIQAKMERLAKTQDAHSEVVPRSVRSAQRLLKLECDRLAACLPSALARPASAAAKTPRKPLSPCKLATSLLDDAQAPAPSQTVLEAALTAPAITHTEVEQGAYAEQMDGVTSPKSASLPATLIEGQATLVEGLLADGPPATPQQLRTAVAELTDQLESAKNTLLGCMGSQTTQCQLDANLAAFVSPVQEMLARQRLSAPDPSSETAPAQQAAGTCSVLTAISACKAMEVDTQSPLREQEPASTNADMADQSIAEADAIKAPAQEAAPVSEADGKSVVITAIEVLAEKLGAPETAGLPVAPAVSALQHEAPILAAPAAVPQAGPTVGVAAEVIKLAAKLDLATVVALKKPISVTDVPKTCDTSRPSCQVTAPPRCLARVSAGNYRGVSNRTEKEISGQQPDAAAALPGAVGVMTEGAAASEGDLMHPETSTQRADVVAADRAMRAGTEGAVAPKEAPVQPGRSSTQATEAEVKGKTEVQATKEAGTPQARDSSPDFGDPLQEEQGTLASVLNTVGKLCRDIDPIQAHAPHNNNVRPAAAVKLTDPTQAHASDSIETQPAKAVRTDLQAAAMLAENAGRAKAGSQGGSLGATSPTRSMKRPDKTTAPQRMDDSAQADVSQTAAAASGSRAPNQSAEPNKSTKPNTPSEKSTGSAGSWEVYRPKGALQQPETHSETTLTAIRPPSKQLSAEQGGEVASPGLWAGAGSMCLAAPGLLDCGRNTPLMKAGNHSWMNSNVRKAGNPAGKVLGGVGATQAKRSAGGNSSRMAQASSKVPDQAPGQQIAKEASSKVDKYTVTECQGDSDVHSSSHSGVKTSDNTRLTNSCIFGPQKARKTSVWKSILQRA